MMVVIVLGAIIFLIGLFEWPYGRWGLPLILIGALVLMIGAASA